ncbi:MAG: AMP-binding protein [Novosphingobium sp.]|nr:AMP-binding protein [Novosphingobium sp.]
MTNIVERFFAVAQEVGNKPLLIEDGQVRLRYDALEPATASLAERLTGYGAQLGDRIVVQVEKSAEAVLLYLAALRAGLVYVPLNTSYTAEELRYFIEDAEPRVIVCDPADGPAMERMAGHATCRVLTLGPRGEGSLMQGLRPAEERATAARNDDDLACILYTSGTTGRSKGAMLSHDNLASNALTLDELWRWQRDDVLIHALPIYHVHGLFVALHGALLAGATILFHPRFDPARVIADLPRASVFMAVPTQYVRLLDQPGLDRRACAGMRLFTSGSAPLLAETHERFAEQTGHRILERYGMTEAGMIASNPYAGARIAGTVGFPLAGVEVRIADDRGRPVAPGEKGVLEVRGPNVFKGYWRNPEKTAQEFRSDGFFVTGDVAEMDGEGRITLVGRAKDLIISGGLNIYPKEIEMLIDEFPGVGETAVIGVPHRDFGEGVVAVVTPAPGASGLTEEAIVASLDGRLARYKHPKRVVLVPELPRNVMGKVQKAELRRAYAQLLLPGELESPR